MNKTFMTGVDDTQEYLLKWWYKNIIKHNPDVHITICDFGMSEKVKQWAKVNADCFVEYPKHKINAWFNKTQCLIDSKYEYTCWIDVDCEVLRSIQDVFAYAQQDKICLTRDWAREFSRKNEIWWATGFNLIKGDSSLLQDWHDVLKEEKVRGDQEALQELITQNPIRNKEIIELPQIYQWLRLSLQRHKDNKNKRVVHWTGPIGKKHIKEELMNEDDFNFNT